MGKRSPASGDRPSQGECKRKCGKHNLSSEDHTDALANKDLRNLSESDMEKEKYVFLSKFNNAGEKDLQTTKIVLTEKGKEYAVPIDSPLSQKGELVLEMVENHTEVCVEQKEIMMKQENSANETEPSQRMPGELTSCVVQEDIAPVFETDEANKVNKNLKGASFSMSIVTKESDVSMIVGSSDEKRPELSFKEDSNSSLQNVQDHSSADVTALLDIVDMDSTMKNDRKASGNNNFNPLVGRNVDSLTEDLNMASVKTSMVSGISSNSHGVNVTYTKRNKSATSEEKSVSFGTFESTQKNGSSPLSQVAENNNFACSSVSLENAGSDTVYKNDTEASVGGYLVLLTRKESSSKNKDDNMVKMWDMLPNIDSKSNMFSEINSVPELANNNDSVLKERSTGDAFADANKSNMFTENSVSEVVRNSDSSECQKLKQKVEEKVFDCSQFNIEVDQDGPPVTTLVLVEVDRFNVDDFIENNQILDVVVKTNGSEMSAGEVSSSGDHFVPEVASNSYHAEASRTSVEVFACGDADGSDRDPVSDVERTVRELNVRQPIHADQESDSVPRQKNENLLDDFRKAPEGCLISSGKNLKILPSDSKEGVSLPPPIRGVIENSSSFDLPSKPKLDSSHEKGSNFSLQIREKVLMDDSHLNYPVITGAGSENVKVATCQHNASNFAYNHGETTNDQEKEVASSSIRYAIEDVTSLGVTKDQDEETKAGTMPLEGALVNRTGKKLLVLDLNGLLADVNSDYRNIRKAHKRVGGKAVFKRPFCDDFLKFCFEKFDIGVWSSRKKYNVDALVDFLVGNLKHNLLFSWDESKCTHTGFKTIENKHKPLVLKELKKLWDKEEQDLPWDKGRYSPSNTLLVDDSPYKALCNPPYTAIFPRPYHFEDVDDNSLGPEGDLHVYLEGLAVADDVQHYIQEHPFGQDAITDTDPSWNFYLQVVETIEKTSVAA
ncbi:uncharacterized protein LOC103718221 isoform X1 [Phoenix dactylifera]|uniref:Uncharacterized protein LOC103718221 isoform X1 n=2 Tax=Phoenix dactylifera TaxID=42345 RepID=A0A8B7CS50_PHODC|nr:uncharacterized protein LOC103718221 isoform X1 [Phoenix dactylifera]